MMNKAAVVCAEDPSTFSLALLISVLCVYCIYSLSVSIEYTVYMYTYILFVYIHVLFPLVG